MIQILVTGAKGFVGKNLCESLKTVRDGKDLRFPEFTEQGLELMEYDIDSSPDTLDDYCKRADFVFHFAGVNRPDNIDDFYVGNRDSLALVLNALRRHGNVCPVMYASSIQATLEGRFRDSEYGRSKRSGEQLLSRYAKETGAKALIYRFPNIFGKWCKPNYNSVVATFCYNIAHDLPIFINDRNTDLELLYIDDLVEEMLMALQGREHREIQTEDSRCMVPTTHRVTLGEIADMLQTMRQMPQTLMMPRQPQGSFAKKLFATYLSYLPANKAVVDLNSHSDERGSFTEIIKTIECGQFSVNVSNPGITKGDHWHHTKWEIFIVVAGHALIRQRNMNTDEIIDVEVDGRSPQMVFMIPGYTHNIINLSDTEQLVTLMWANESFNPLRPDTYRECVEIRR